MAPVRDYAKLAKDIVELVGGRQYLKHCTLCHQASSGIKKIPFGGGNQADNGKACLAGLSQLCLRYLHCLCIF